MSSDDFWGSDPSILFNQKRLIEFFPISDQSTAERMNAISRLVIYTSAFLYVYHKSSKYIVFGFFLLGVIYVIWNNQTKENFGYDNNGSSFNVADTPIIDSSSSAVKKTNCVMPTSENPFMNPVPWENITLKPCSGKNIQTLSEDLLNGQLIDNNDDLMNVEANQRLFMTVPVRDREKYAKWLFKGAPNCKEDNYACQPYEDLRWNRTSSSDEDISAISSLYDQDMANGLDADVPTF